MKCRLSIVLLILILSACLSNTEDAFMQIKSMEGSWNSTGTILISQQWTQKSDSLMEGQVYTLTGYDTSFLERYTICKFHDSVFFQLGEDDPPSQLLLLKKVRRNALLFENTQRSYPNRIRIEWENDSLFLFRKENSRGNKPIEFQMRRNWSGLTN